MLYHSKYLIYTFSLLTLPSNCQQNRKSSNSNLYSNNINSRCTPIGEGEYCHNWYNTTLFPNRFNHQSLPEAQQKMNYMQYLFKQSNQQKPCHQYLEMFLCLNYMPICTDNKELVIPCQGFCNTVLKKCKSELNSLGMFWPAELRCSELPNKSDYCYPMPNENTKVIDLNGLSANLHSAFGCQQTEIDCPADLKLASKNTISRNRYTFLTTSSRDIHFCGAPCDDDALFWTSSDRAKVRISIAIASAFSLLTTAFAIATYCTDASRFRYPEKPIIWLAACYFFISFSYLLGALTSNDISCKSINIGESGETEKSIISQGTDNTDCTLSFMLLYFFSIAVGVWWVILALTWLLAAGWKWSSEAIERISQYFHFAAWGLPTILTLIILSQGKVDGDSLSGVCFTGQLDSKSLYFFVFLPGIACLILGSVCLCIGFIALFNIRRAFKRDRSLYASNHSNGDNGSSHFDQRASIAKLEALMMKIGMFSIGYVIPAGVVLACIYYESSNYDSWVDSWLIKQANLTSDTVPEYCELKESPLHKHQKTPSLAIFLAKYMVQLFLGTICGLWVWSKKTMHQWFSFFGCGAANLYDSGNNGNVGRQDMSGGHYRTSNSQNSGMNGGMNGGINGGMNGGMNGMNSMQQMGQMSQMNSQKHIQTPGYHDGRTVETYPMLPQNNYR